MNGEKMNLRWKKLKKDKNFLPCADDNNDELYPNGSFAFNITKMIVFIEKNKDKIILENIDVKSYRYHCSSNLNESAVESADMSVPLILAEISPGMYNLIDGHHRSEKAFRFGMKNLSAYKMTCPQHLAFLTSKKAYSSYIEYWNGKIDELR